MNAFNPTRFMKLLKWRMHFDAQFTWGALLGAWIPMIVISIVCFVITSHHTSKSYLTDDFTQLVSTSVTVSFMIIWAILPPMLLPKLERKDKEIKELLLPASNTERYLSSYFSAICFSFLVLVIAWLLTNILQYTFSLYWFHEAKWLYIDLSGMTAKQFTFQRLILLHSILLFATSLRMNIYAVFVPLLLIGFFTFPTHFPLMLNQLWIALPLIVLCYVLSFRRYCRREITHSNLFSL